MIGKTQTFQISLCYEAYFGETVEVAADDFEGACHFAMAHADDCQDWKDTMVSSTHWIESVEYGAEVERSPNAGGA